MASAAKRAMATGRIGKPCAPRGLRARSAAFLRHRRLSEKPLAVVAPGSPRRPPGRNGEEDPRRIVTSWSILCSPFSICRLPELCHAAYKLIGGNSPLSASPASSCRHPGTRWSERPMPYCCSSRSYTDWLPWLHPLDHDEAAWLALRPRRREGDLCPGTECTMWRRSHDDRLLQVPGPSGLSPNRAS
jgi:hypothetical protein